MARATSKIEFYVDFSELEQFIGAGLALADSGEDKYYLGEIAKAAFEGTETEFNRSAAAYAQAGGRIKHMFEWGTPGINKGRTNMKANPNSERARLWGTHLTGIGLNQRYAYFFKPSVAYVPKPTKRDTGMSTEVISKLKNHVFRDKAMVMETGMEVIIKRKGNHPWLLLPIYQDHVPPNVRPHDVKRGYGLAKGPISATPGASTQGNFTTYWRGWWDTLGQESVNKLTTTFVEEDFLAEIEISRPGGLRPVQTENIRAAVAKERARIRKNAQQRAYRRRKKLEERNRT